MADVLFGDVSPSGRLPFTVVHDISQLPDELDMNMSATPGRTYRYSREGMNDRRTDLVYSYLTDEPLWAFGYGLSYTNFTYKDMTVKPTQVSAKV